MEKKMFTILVAEDSPADAEMTIDALREARLANPIVHVEDGVEAMDWLLQRGEHEGRESATRRWCCWTSRCRAWTGWKCSSACARRMA